MDSATWHIATGIMAFAATVCTSLLGVVLMDLRNGIRDLRNAVS